MSRRYVRYAAWVIGWWTAYGVFNAVRYREMPAADGRPGGWAGALPAELTSALLWVPSTVLIIWLVERFPLGARPGGSVASAMVAHLGGLAATVLGRAGAVALLNDEAGWYPELPSGGQLLETSFFNTVFLYALVTGMAHAVHYARVHRLREEQLARAEINALRAQVRPHFLFNALNTIAAHVRDEPRTAERMIDGLSLLLRRSLDSDGSLQVPLSTELDLVRSYLDIEQVRFADRLTVRWDVDDATLDALVPPLVLQPLAENAVRHGLWPRAAAGVVTVSARRDSGSLVLAVEDDGVGLDASAHRPPGLGNANLAARLTQLYGGSGRFSLRPRSSGGTVATVTVPYRRSDAPVPR